MRIIPLLVLAACAAAAEPSFRRDGDRLTVELDGGVRLGFALRGDLLLGLNEASVGGVALKSPATAQRPLLAQEWPQLHPQGPLVGHALRLVEAKRDGDGIAIVVDVLGTRAQGAARAAFLWAADRERALGAAITPELARLKAARDAVDAALEPALAAQPAVTAAAAKHAEAKAAHATAQAATPPDKKAVERAAKAAAAAEKALAEARVAARRELLAQPAHAEAARTDAAFETALEAHALDVGRIHRDYYRFAHLQLPADFCALDRLAAFAAIVPAAEAVRMGRLTWTVRPSRRAVAGWVWQGWAGSIAYELEPGCEVAALRMLGSWELGGGLDGLGVIAVRYRGLGGFAPTLRAPAGQGMQGSFTTTEMIPGAAGGAPVISPAVPPTTSIDDRGYGLLHRAGAWIARLARGAGHPLMDFQHRQQACFTVVPERQGALRALTEAFPGDAVLSQTDEELHPLGRRFASTPMHHLVLVADLPEHERRTRWLEMDQDARDRVSAELGFVQHEVRPAVGFNFDHNFGGQVAALAARVPALAQRGVRQIFVHHPGWVNGRAIRSGAKGDLGADGKPQAFVGGGDCAIYDWVPLKEVEQPWQALQRAAAKHQVAYAVWVTGMVQKDGALHGTIGADLRHWAINAPGDTTSSGYPPNLFNLNLLDPAFRKVFDQRMANARRDFGYQGIWADSFQNLFMTTLDWANGTGAPLQRAWWEWIAAQTREGVLWCAESQAVPGLSCSLEADDHERPTWWASHHAMRWYRTGVPHAGSPAADRVAFRVMAAKGWLAPPCAGGKEPEASIPSFARFAREYEAALPAMRRGWILDGERGALWLPFAGDGEGVWFSFVEQDLPAGVTAVGIVDGAAAPRAQAERTYRVRAADLVAAFGLRRGPEADGRLGRAWTQPGHGWPAWAKE